MSIKAVLGGKKYYKFNRDPWTGELIALYTCPKCDKIIDYGLTNVSANFSNYCKYYYKYWTGRIKMPSIGTECGKHSYDIETKTY